MSKVQARLSNIGAAFTFEQAAKLGVDDNCPNCMNVVYFDVEVEEPKNEVRRA